MPPTRHTPGAIAFEAWAQEQVGDSGYRPKDHYWDALTKDERDSWERIAKAAMLGDPEYAPTLLPQEPTPQKSAAVLAAEAKLRKAAAELENALAECRTAREDFGREVDALTLAVLTEEMGYDEFNSRCAPLLSRSPLTEISQAERAAARNVDSAREELLLAVDRDKFFARHRAEILWALNMAHAAVATQGYVELVVRRNKYQGFTKTEPGELCEDVEAAEKDELDEPEYGLFIPLKLNLENKP